MYHYGTIYSMHMFSKSSSVYGHRDFALQEPTTTVLSHIQVVNGISNNIRYYLLKEQSTGIVIIFYQKCL